MAAVGWSDRVLELLLKLNNLQRAGCLPFCVQGQRVGWVTPRVAQVLAQSSSTFTLSKEPSARLELSDGLRTPLELSDGLRAPLELSDGHRATEELSDGHRATVEPSDGLRAPLELSEGLLSPSERTRAVQEVMDMLRGQDVFPCLREWRDEHYDVKGLFSDPPLLRMERAATPLLGVPRYGVHVNGFLRRGTDVFMWIARRSLTKPNHPGKLDHVAAGGISAGSGVWETLLKECTEEACIPESLASKARPAGTVSYAYQQDEAVYLECQFVFDLEVPESFQPRVGDGEVQEFYLWPLDKVTDAIATQEFKPNCALVVLDFLMRHGHIRPDAEKFYTKFVENLHRPL